ncbi:MAG TPA: SDR family oxidoreductase, partial [Burkholderiales bacterium]|nr:SDR family oxidoreductase [Burkholderiales bacterium]
DWDVIGLARRAPSEPLPGRLLQVDLSDPAACRAQLAELSEITHVIYCARANHTASAKEPIELNLAMLRNVLDAVEPAARGLQHVHLLQGSKFYGSDLGPYKTPARESDPRVAENNWYYEQQDFIAERSGGREWRWSASRPHAICDGEPDVARSLPKVIAVYAAILKEMGEPLSFPGTAANFHALYQCVDATLLAEAIAWMTTTPACANRAFNVTNGDFIRWKNLWPRFAEYFGMRPGAVKTINLAQFMADKAPVWQRIVARHGLRPVPLGETALWSYGDFVFTPGYDIMSDTLKLRQSGFARCLDTEQMFIELFDRLHAARVVP